MISWSLRPDHCTGGRTHLHAASIDEPTSLIYLGVYGVIHPVRQVFNIADQFPASSRVYLL
jgi:hypothetical protein